MLRVYIYYFRLTVHCIRSAEIVDHATCITDAILFQNKNRENMMLICCAAARPHGTDLEISILNTLIRLSISLPQTSYTMHYARITMSLLFHSICELLFFLIFFLKFYAWKQQHPYEYFPHYINHSL